MPNLFKENKMSEYDNNHQCKSICLNVKKQKEKEKRYAFMKKRKRKRNQCLKVNLTNQKFSIK